MPKRYFICGLTIFVLTIFCVLSSPDLRRLIVWQIPFQPHFMGLESWQNNAEEISEDHDNDLRVLAWRASYDRDKNHVLKQLIARYPREKWLVPLWLDSIAQRIYLDDGRKIPSSYALSSIELRAALHTVENAGRADPQNSYYDWMRIGLHLALKENEAARKVAANAAGKTRFDDGFLHKYQLSREVGQMLHPVQWEESWLDQMGQLVSYSSLFFSINHALAAQALSAEARGQHARALQIYGNQMRLVHTFRREAKSKVHIGMALTALRILYSGKNRPRIEPDRYTKMDWPTANRRAMTDQAALFAAYARRHGRNDLAIEAFREADECTQADLAIIFSDSPFRANVPRETMIQIATAQGAGAILICCAILGLGVWSPLTVSSWIARHFHRLTPPGSVPLRDIILSTAPAILLLAVALWLMPRLQIFAEPYSWGILPNDVRDKQSLNFFSYGCYAVLSPLVLSFSTISVATLTRAWRARPHPQNESDRPLRIQGKPWQILGYLLALAYWAPIAYGVNQTLYNCVIVQKDLNHLDLKIMLWLLLVAVVAHWLAWRAMAIWSMRPLQWRYALAWIRSSAGVLATAALLAWLPLMLASFPARHVAAQRIEDCLHIGRVPLLRKAYFSGAKNWADD